MIPIHVILIYLWVLFVFVITSLIMPKPAIRNVDPIKRKAKWINFFHLQMKKILFMFILPTILLILNLIIPFILTASALNFCTLLNFLLSLLTFFANAFFLTSHRHYSYKTIGNKLKFISNVYEFDDEGNIHYTLFDKRLLFIATIAIFVILFFGMLIKTLR